MKRLILFLLPVVVLTATACQPVKPYAVIVNGHTISDSVIKDELKVATSNPRYRQALDQELSAGSGAGGLQPAGSNTVNSSYTAQLVFNRVLVQLIDDRVAKDKLVVSAQDRTDAQVAVKKGFNDDALFNSLPVNYQNYLIGRQANLNAIVRALDTPAKEQDYYKSHTSSFTNYCVRHILVKDQQQAQDIYTQLQGGGDFATLAKANSIDTSSAPDGGDLKCLTSDQVNQFVAPFANAVFAAVPGVIQQPVQTQYGFHVIEVTSKTQQTFEQAQPAISQTLASSQAFFTDALIGLKIKVNPRYGDYVPSDPTTGAVGHIVPHPASTASSSATAPPSAAATGSSGNTAPNTAPAQ